MIFSYNQVRRGGRIESTLDDREFLYGNPGPLIPHHKRRKMDRHGSHSRCKLSQMLILPNGQSSLGQPRCQSTQDLDLRHMLRLSCADLLAQRNHLRHFDVSAPTTEQTSSDGPTQGGQVLPLPGSWTYCPRLPRSHHLSPMQTEWSSPSFLPDPAGPAQTK